MRIEIAMLAVLAGCPKGGGSQPRGTHDCDDVEAHAAKIYTEDARSRGTEEDKAVELGTMEGLNQKAVCLDTWNTETIECYVVAANVDQSKACVP